MQYTIKFLSEHLILTSIYLTGYSLYEFTRKCIIDSMDVPKEAFFEAIRNGDVDGLLDILDQEGLEETGILAKSLNEDGETPLLLAISENCQEVVEFLIHNLNVPVEQHGLIFWDDYDSEEAPPLFSAICYNQKKVPTIVNLLIDKELATNKIGEYRVLNSVLSSNTIIRSQKITILELIGAAYILKKPETGNTIMCGLQCWIEATHLRGLTVHEEDPIPKSPDEISDFSRQVFGSTSEFTTREELQQIDEEGIGHLKIQALLIIERIFDLYELDLNLFYFHEFHDFWLQFLMHSHQYRRAINSSMLIIDTIVTRQLEENIYTWRAYCDIMFKIIDVMSADTFQLLRKMPSYIQDGVQLKFPTLMNAVEAISSFFCQILSRPNNATVHIMSTEIEKTLCCIFSVLVLLAEMLPLVNSEESRQLLKWLNDFNRYTNRRCNMSTLLHYACRRFEPDLPIGIIQLLLDTGADPNAVNSYGQPPVHFLGLFPVGANHYITNAVQKAQLLVNAGAHLDIIHRNGQSVLQRLKLLSRFANSAILKSFVNQVPRLTCRCAQVIRQNRIPFENQQLPPVLLSFLISHGANLV